MLTVDHVSGGYADHPIIKDVTFSVKKGEFFGIVGPNGSGKTTLLKMISGLIPVAQGSILVNDKNITRFSKKELARTMAVLPQLTSQTFPYTVKDTIALGRYAHHNGLFQTWTETDESILQKILKQTNVERFAEASLHELSGGEQQRVFLAQALVQQPQFLLLDEPTNHLDLAHQKELLDLLKKSTAEQKMTVISIFHDLNLASLYCDRLLLLRRGQTKMLDTPIQVLTEPIIEEVYQTTVKTHPHPEVAKPQLHMMPRSELKLENNIKIDESYLVVKKEHILLKSPIPLRTLSTGICGSGVGWHSYFVICDINKAENCNDPAHDIMQRHLITHNFHPKATVGMMTAIKRDNVAFQFWRENQFSLFIVVIAGAENAINTWIFVNGKLKETAFIQTVMSAMEAKVEALKDMNIATSKTNKTADTASTDNILIAATQQGKFLSNASSTSVLVTAIRGGVYTLIKKVIRNTQ